MGDRYLYEVSYGKHAVAVYRVYQPIPESSFVGRNNNLLACEISVDVFGDEFLTAYTRGENAMVVATDSMKNFIIRESLAYPGSTMEGLLYFLGEGFGRTYEQLHTLKLAAAEIPFTPLVVPAGDGRFEPGGNLFSRENGARAVASLSVERRDGKTRVTRHHCGINGIAWKKLTGSSFTSFVRDDYTTLPERRDRPLYIAMDVEWRYGNIQDLLDVGRGRYVPKEQMVDLLAATFDDFVSESIQHLLHEMGDRALERFPQLTEMRFDARNLTRDPFGARDDDPSVKVYSDPFPAYGRLTLTICRPG
jgi:urate oxidase / 2-oxo-4-hydroxy-4-carboxy-5-ureidoimidazoline decarboxylase